MEQVMKDNWSLVLEPTSKAQWCHLLHEAQGMIGWRMSAGVESYILLMLEHYSEEGGFDCVIALDYMRSLAKSGREKLDGLRHVGDRCLLMTGLFPERIISSTLPVSYYVGVGQSAYREVAHSVLNVKELAVDRELYLDLSLSFVGVMDVLTAMRHVSSD